METMIRFLTLLALILSIYAYRVVSKTKKYKKYKPLCDISKNISCTKAFFSKEGSLTGIPNPIIGILFYSLLFLLAALSKYNLIFILSIPAVLGSIYFSYISYFKQRNFCLICSTIYIINILILVQSWP